MLPPESVPGGLKILSITGRSSGNIGHGKRRKRHSLRGVRNDRDMRQLTLFDEEELAGVEDSAPEEIKNAWRKAKQDMKRNFSELQAKPYEEKINRQTGIAWEFHEEIERSWLIPITSIPMIR